MPPAEPVLVVAILLLVAVFAGKVSGRFGIPALLLFPVIGMLAGSDGPGGIEFDDVGLASSIGAVALATSSSLEAWTPSGLRYALSSAPAWRWRLLARSSRLSSPVLARLSFSTSR
jgi:NhaP-type Na+/H+ and K+/H+ antiporter